MYKDFFEQIGTTSTKIKMPKHGWLDMNNLSKEKAKELWDEKFPYLSLTKKGAAHYFGKTKPVGLVSLIENAKCKEDVNALLTVSKDKAVKEAAIKRLKELKR